MSGKSHDLISTSLYYVSKHATRERIKSQLNCHVTFRRQLHHSILSSPYYQLLLYPTAETVSVNGSSQNGKCSSTSSFNNSHSICEAPTSSVLFDGHIPTLTGLDGDTWASQLLALQIRNPFGIEITSDLTGRSGVKRVELVMFNCPEWEIAVVTIGIWRATSISTTSRTQAGAISPTITSCNSLVRVCTSSLAITQYDIDLSAIHPCQWL